MIQAQTVGLGAIDPALLERLSAGFWSNKEVVQKTRKAIVPWYIQYKWPLVIGSIGALAVAAYYVAK